MPYYILLSNLTDEGWKTIREKPERIKEVNKELEAFGVRVEVNTRFLDLMTLQTLLKLPTTKL